MRSNRAYRFLMMLVGGGMLFQTASCTDTAMSTFTTTITTALTDLLTSELTSYVNQLFGVTA